MGDFYQKVYLYFDTKFRWFISIIWLNNKCKAVIPASRSMALAKICLSVKLGMLRLSFCKLPLFSRINSRNPEKK